MTVLPFIRGWQCAIYVERLVQNSWLFHALADHLFLMCRLDFWRFYHPVLIRAGPL